MRIDYRGNPLLFSFLHVELPWQSIILQLVHLIGYNALSCRIRKLIIKYLEFEVHILINNNEPIVHVVFFFQDDSLQLRKTWRMALGCPREVTVHYTELNTEELSLCCTALTSVSFSWLTGSIMNCHSQRTTFRASYMSLGTGVLLGTTTAFKHSMPNAN